jgi:dihydrofolate synthase/folylpolyglutamate synthase
VIDLDLGRIERLLADLGHPERRLPPVVHVAGTNGKGSVVAILRALLEALGQRVHVYTSPHLVRFNERIVVAGREIDDPALCEVLAECERIDAGRPITFFEITTAAAFLAFAGTEADYTLLETGLGGRLDATNVVARPAVTALTPISLDHQHYLGATLAAIASEKAGILKPGVPCVSAGQAPGAAAVIRERAAAIGAPLLWENRAWRTVPSDHGFRFVLLPGAAESERDDALSFPLAGGGGGEGEFMHRREAPFALDLPPPALPGTHQITNAGVALACLFLLSGALRGVGPGIEPALEAGLRTVRWPARLQRLAAGRLAALLPEAWELWLDGGHNPAAGETLARHAAAEWRDRPLHLIFGMLRTKDPEGFLRPLVPRVTRMRTVPIPGEDNALPAAEAARDARALGLDAHACPGVAEALTEIAAAGTGPARVLICGSLYLAGAVLAENGG